MPLLHRPPVPPLAERPSGDLAVPHAEGHEAHLERPLTEADIPALVAMEQAACLHPVHAWSEDNYRSSLRSGYACVVRCEAVSGRLLGVCVTMDGPGEMHLLNIATERMAQGRGLARAMLARLYARCAQQQAALLWLEVRPSNTRAVQLYTAQGFETVGVRKSYYPAPEGREDALVMRRAVDWTGASHAMD